MFEYLDTLTHTLSLKTHSNARLRLVEDFLQPRIGGAVALQSHINRVGENGCVDDGVGIVFADGAVQKGTQLRAPVFFGARP